MLASVGFAQFVILSYFARVFLHLLPWPPSYYLIAHRLATVLQMPGMTGTWYGVWYSAEKVGPGWLFDHLPIICSWDFARGCVLVVAVPPRRERQAGGMQDPACNQCWLSPNKMYADCFRTETHEWRAPSRRRLGPTLLVSLPLPLAFSCAHAPGRAGSCLSVVSDLATVAVPKRTGAPSRAHVPSQAAAAPSMTDARFRQEND